VTPRVAVKGGVYFGAVTSAQIRMLTALDVAAMESGVVLTVTCAREGHGEDNPHTRGQAIDVRARNLDAPTVLQVHRRLMQILGPAFTVLYEVPRRPYGVLADIAYVNPKATAPHFHLQAKKGTSWPPADVPGVSA
jgi:hypothetical protein